jgi:hypothetical protein
MKKVLTLAMLLVFIAAFATGAFAEGSVTVSKSTVNGGDIEIVSFAFIANATGVATVPATSSSTVYPGDKAGYILKMVTDPGATAPTDDYDITLIDATTGADLMGGEGANRDTANSEEAAPKIGNAYAANFAPVAFTMTLTGNSANSATGTVYVYIAK